MNIQIDSEKLNALFRHGEDAYPQECCGILLGKVSGDRKTILQVIPTRNAWDENSTDLATIAGLPDRDRQKERNFSIAPEDLLNAQKEARNRQEIVLGFYHSHPDAEPIPSEFDRAIAWSNYSYLILSIERGQARAIKSWQLDESRQFQPEAIEIVGVRNNSHNP